MTTRFTTAHDRFQVGRYGVGFLLSFTRLSDALDYCNESRFRNELEVFDAMAHIGKPELWDGYGKVLRVRQATEPVKGEQPGMLGVPGKVHVQKRPYSIGQEELEDYGKYKRQMLIEYDKQYSLEQLKDMCRAKGFSVSGDKKTLIGRLI